MESCWLDVARPDSIRAAHDWFLIVNVENFPPSSGIQINNNHYNTNNTNKGNTYSAARDVTWKFTLM
jgi:hypothetical protein